MKKYKRWILILTALHVFVVVQVDSLRATSLIHAGKFPKLLNQSSTSSTTASPSSDKPASNGLKELLDDLPDDDDAVYDANGTKINFTGIPQIDYVWDPNLPRELNGFNLSSYPFLDSMPADEDIDFDCEDKKNGFYASIKFGCQLYHHCLYGVRSDFICANFTAFDMKTFICHFVSEVDCKNSYRYWNRNDDLYKATTQKPVAPGSNVMPLIDRGFYNRTRHGSLNGGSSSSQNTNSNSNSNSNSNNNNNNNNNDPQYTPIIQRSNTNSNNNAEKTQSSNRDPPANSNNANTNNNRNNNNNDDFNGGRPSRPMRRPPYRRRPVDYNYYDDDYEEEFFEDRGRRRNRPRTRRPYYDDDYDTRDTRRPLNRRPYYDDYDYEYERRPVRNRNRSEPRNNSGRFDDRRGANNNENRRRPAYDDDKKKSGDRKQLQSDDDSKNRRDESRRNQSDVNDELKPNGQSLFDRPRPPPRISRPVPQNEKNKFSYNSDTGDDVTSTVKSIVAATTTKPFAFQKLKPAPLTTTKSTTAEPSLDEATEIEYVYEDEYEDTPTLKPTYEISSASPKEERASIFNSRLRNENVQSSTLATTTTTTAASSPDSFRLNRYKSDIPKENSQQLPITANNNRKFANKQTVFDAAVTQETPVKLNNFKNAYINRNLENKHGSEPTVAFKRPFLPSRGGEPYKARGLQPVGILAEQQKASDDKLLPNNDGNEKQQSETHKLTLEDLYNEEYDVDLNDALNPMLKPLTSSRNVHGYSSQTSNVNVNDPQKSQTQRISSKADHFIQASPATTLQPEYYDDEVEYSYEDDAV